MKGYMLPLALTKEMQIAFDTYKVQLNTADDFSTGLQLFRIGLVVVGTLTADGLASMLKRKRITNEEIDIYVSKGWITDFRAEHEYALARQQRQGEETTLRRRLRNVIPQFTKIAPRGQIQWYNIAMQNPDLDESKQIIKLAKTVLNECGEVTNLT